MASEGESVGSLRTDLRIGCSGWSYKDWVGPFYPKGTAPADFLGIYSQIFDTVEVNSTFYRVPSPFLVERWRKVTPDGFLFTAKFPRRITHEHKLQGISDHLDRFYQAVGRFGEKLGGLVIQLPPSFKYDDEKGVLEAFLDETRDDHKHAIEFRHRSWFRSDIYTLLRDRNVALCWSTNQYLSTPSETPADFMYLRMVGDRSIKSFGGIQKNRSEEMRFWKKELQRRAETAREGFVFFNNHFAGFGPGSVNEFRRLLGLMEREWTKTLKGSTT